MVLTPLLMFERADSRTRTGDPRITNALLYQLSHIGSFSKISCSKAVAKVRINEQKTKEKINFLCFFE